MFNLDGVVLPPTEVHPDGPSLSGTSSLPCPIPQMFQWREAGRCLGTSAVGEMKPVFGSFLHLDRSSGRIGSAVDYGFLSRRNHADVERHLSSIDPVSDINVRRARLGVEDEAFPWSGSETHVAPP